MSTSTLDRIEFIGQIIIFSVMVISIFIGIAMQLGSNAGDCSKDYDPAYETAKMIEEYNNEN